MTEPSFQLAPFPVELASLETPEVSKSLFEFWTAFSNQEKLPEVHRLVAYLNSRHAALSIWFQVRDLGAWCTQVLDLVLSKYRLMASDEKQMGFLGNAPTLSWLAHVAGATPQKISAYRSELAGLNSLGALYISSILDEDYIEFLRAGDWLSSKEKLPLVASWMLMGMLGVSGTATPLVEANRRFTLDVLEDIGEHAKFFLPQVSFLDSYYIDEPRTYARLRALYFRWARAKGLDRQPSGHPEALSAPLSFSSKPRVGIVCANWVKAHAAYRALHRQVYALKDRFEIVLVNIHPEQTADDIEQFSEVVHVKLIGQSDGASIAIGLDDKALLAAKLDVLYYVESFTREVDALMMARRYAPVQVTGYGIMSSTKSPTMDWYITGSWAEPEKIQKHYSERICQVPGMGMLSEQRKADPFVFPDGFPRLVSAANQVKYRFEYLNTLGKIMERVSADSRLLMLPNNPQIDGVWTGAQAKKIIGPKLEYAFLATNEYQPLIASAVVLLDSFPFCGYTTLMDAFSYGTPAVTYEGFGAFGRAGAGVARAAGLPDWTIARSSGEYVEAAVHIANNPSVREELKQTILRHQEILFGKDQERYLGDALELILKNPSAKFLKVQPNKSLLRRFGI